MRRRGRRHTDTPLGPIGPHEAFRPRRRRLRARPRIPRAAFPSTFTLLNLLSGFYAIINASQGNYVMAAWLIAAAGLFDLLDGMMARLVDGTSEFGVELDSLADIVSFGVAPAFLLYEFGLHELGLAGVVVAGLPAVCGAVRLARFNLTFTEKKDYFEGLPIPAQAAAVIAFVLVFDGPAGEGGIARSPSVLIPLVVTLSVLMVSTVRFDALPVPTPRYLRRKPLKALAGLIGVFLLIFLQEVGLFIALAVYLLHGVGRALVWAFRTATDEAEPEPETAPLDAPSPP